jgi:hypothetical protein
MKAGKNEVFSDVHDMATKYMNGTCLSTLWVPEKRCKSSRRE